jgi:hypothetical protein
MFRILFALSFFLNIANAQDQIGAIEFEEAVREDTYTKSQDNVIKVFESLASQVNQGKITELKKSFSENEINYLNGAYLYCSSQRGVCREIPQVIFELDLIASKISNSVNCTNSLAFWRQWLANDMEERSKHLVKTGHIKDVDFFIRQVRPQFVQCQKTISSLLEDKKKPFSQFFEERYKDGTVERNAVLAAPRVLQVIRDSVPNVFIATGSIEPKPEAKKKK